jgi:hypothetical protein
LFVAEILTVKSSQYHLAVAGGCEAKTRIKHCVPTRYREVVLTALLAIVVEPPISHKIMRQLLLRNTRSNHLDGNTIFMKQRVVVLPVRHLSGINQLLVHCVLLQSTNQIGDLIKRTIASIE